MKIPVVEPFGETGRAGTPLTSGGKLSPTGEGNQPLQNPMQIVLLRNSQVVYPIQVQLENLTNGLTSHMNTYLGNPLDSPLTVQTLDNLMEKFWTSPDDNKNAFCDLIWNCCRETAEELARQAGRKVSSVSARVDSKMPVVFSTREGLGIDLDWKPNGNGLSVASVSISPAGSHVNVARALNNFGTPSEVIGIASESPIGKIFLELLEKEGVDTSRFLKIQGDTRFFLCNFTDGKEYWIVSVAPHINGSDIERLTDEMRMACKRHEKEVLALANNPPAGASDDYMPLVMREAQDKYGMFTIYDTKLQAVGNDLITEVLKTGVGLIKPNVAEFGQYVGMDPEKLRQDKDLIAHLARGLIAKYGVKMILVSLDKDGAMLIDKKRVAVANAPKIEVACTVGAGDTGIGAIIDRSKKENYSLYDLSDDQFRKTLSAFVAAGSATASKPGTVLGTLEEVQDLEKQVKTVLV